MPRLSLSVALGVGAAGALVDVSSYARLPEGLTRRWGRDDAFYGLEPGTFSFTLDNADGRFTPENPSSPLVTKLSEGMAACVSVGGRLTAGTVRSIEPEFPGGEAGWAVVRVTCVDAFGELSRIRVGSPTEAAAFALGARAFWSFADPAGSLIASSVVPFSGAITWRGATEVEFGVTGTAPGGRDQATVRLAAGLASYLTADDGFDNAPTQFEPGMSWSAWVTPRNITSKVVFRANLADVFLSLYGEVTIDNGRFTANGVFSEPFEVGRAYHLCCERVGDTVTTYIDGVALSSYTGVPASAGQQFDIFVGDVGYGPNEFSIADLTVTATRIFGEGLVACTTRNRLASISQMTSATWATLPTTFAEPLLTEANFTGSSMLDALNDVMDTEQGDVYTTTTGTLTSPTNRIVARPRTRPTTVTATFDVENELSGAPNFIRDLTNLLATVSVVSDAGTTVVTDSNLAARAGSASGTADVLLALDAERRHWGQDRLQRGANTKMRIASVVVDAMTTPTDRTADLLALVPGDRVQFTGLPSTVLGFTTWDGWFLGASERHTINAHEFELFFTPVLPDTAVYDTDRFMANGELTLAAARNAIATTFSIASTGALLSTTDVPYTIAFGAEQVTVTAVVGASSPQTATVVRGVNGTTATPKVAGAVLMSVPDSLYAF